MGEPREYGPKGGTVLFLDLLANFSPNLSEIDQNRVPSLAQGWYNLTKSLSYVNYQPLTASRGTEVSSQPVLVHQRLHVHLNYFFWIQRISRFSNH